MSKFLKSFTSQINKHKSLETVAATSFYLALCMGPLCLLILSILTILGLTEKVSITEQMRNIVSPVVIDVIEILYKDRSIVLRDSLFSSILSLGLLLLSSSLFFNQIKKSIRNVFEYKSNKPKLIIYVIKQRFLAIFLTLVFLITVSLSLVLSVIFKSISLPEFIDFKWLQIIGSYLAFFLLFLSLYKLSLRSQIPNRYQFIGASLTALVLQLGQYLFSFYISIVPLKTIYGPISLFVGFLLWSYLFSVSLILSAEVAQFCFLKKKA